MAGAREDLSCHGPNEVTANFVAARDERYDIDALELIPATGHVVLGAYRAGLLEVAGVPLHGEIYNVFAITNNTITRIEDSANRADALTAAAWPTTSRDIPEQPPRSGRQIRS